MSNIVITMKDGTVRKFVHKGRPGGSYTKTIRYEGGMAIITDEYHAETAIPVNDILEVLSKPHDAIY